jgi:hypothetical protein
MRNGDRGHGQAHHVRLTLGYCLGGIDRQSTLSERVSGVIEHLGRTIVKVLSKRVLPGSFLPRDSVPLSQHKPDCVLGQPTTCLRIIHALIITHSISGG